MAANGPAKAVFCVLLAFYGKIQYNMIYNAEKGAKMRCLPWLPRTAALPEVLRSLPEGPGMPAHSGATLL